MHLIEIGADGQSISHLTCGMGISCPATIAAENTDLSPFELGVYQCWVEGDQLVIGDRTVAQAP